MNAGDLRSRGILQQRVNTPDGQGGNGVSWTNVATLWAQVVAVVGAEGVTADQQRPLVTYNITIRFRRGVIPSEYGVDASMRFVIGARIFDIRSVIDEEERHEALILGCELYAP